MEFRVLGPLEVIEEGHAVPVERRLTRALLAYLLLHANEPVPGDRLVDGLWGERPPRTAIASLQNYVARLRKAIGADRLQLEAGGYVLRVDPEWFDLARFDRLVAAARGAPAAQRARRLREAIALWRGEPLCDLAFEEFAQREIAQLQERRLSAIESRIDADLELGAGAELIDELEELIATHPLREVLRAQLMLAFYRAGRQAEALDVYRVARRMLTDELGIEPSEQLRTLERRILEQDPSLVTAGTAPAPESRRTVTVLFCDVVDSAALATRLDPEAYGLLLSSYYEAARGAIEAHGGTVEKFIGEAVMAYFGARDLHEDDALRAVRAALGVRAATQKLASADQLHIRASVNTGEVVVFGDGRAVGPVLNVAAHLGQRAGAGEIVLGEQTYALVREAVRTEPVDLGEGLEAYRVDQLIEAAEPVPRRLDAPMVGRTSELRRLQRTFQQATKGRSCVVATIVGEPGIGKTRLGRELVASARAEARVLFGRCVSYGAGATYLPLAEAVRQAASEASVAGIAELLAGEHDAEQVAQLIAEVIGLGDGLAAPGESFWAVRRLVEALAREQSLVLVFDDVHWAEPTFLDLIEYLGQWAQGPILVLCAARSELLEQRPGWGGPSSAGFLIELEPLERHDVGRLADELAGGRLAPDVRERVIERAGGNPLYAEQLIALAAEVPDATLDQVSPTIEALIAARLDRLDTAELQLLQGAAVVGRVFDRETVADLAPFADADLASLEQKGFVHALPVEPGHQFHHVLVRDCAYRSLPKAQRAELHQRLAENLDRKDGSDELVGYHYERAHELEVEIGRLDERTRKLADAASRRLASAGRRAFGRNDLSAAVSLLTRASELVPALDGRKPGLLIEIGEALTALGRFNDADAMLREAASRASDTRQQTLAGIASWFLRLERGHEVDLPRAESDARRAAQMFASLGDDRAAASAWELLCDVANYRCRFAASRRAARRAIEHAERCHDPRVGRYERLLLRVATYGPTRTSYALMLAKKLLERSPGDSFHAAGMWIDASRLHAMRGEFDAARELLAKASAFDQNGWGMTGTHGDRGWWLERLSGDWERAERELQREFEICTAVGSTSEVSTVAAQLGYCECALNRYRKADEHAQLSAESADQMDVASQVLWRLVRGLVLAHRGNQADAVMLAREACKLAAATDAVELRADALMDLAQILSIGEELSSAREAADQALRLYERKEHRVGAARAKRLLRGDRKCEPKPIKRSRRQRA
jgi:DNA-binding SARP family transcriptional activator